MRGEQQAPQRPATDAPEQRKGSPGEGEQPRRRPAALAWLRFREAGVLGVLALMCFVLSIITYNERLGGSTFLTASNLADVARNFSWIAIMAVGEVLVIITAGIDLSVGATLALSAVVLAKLISADHLALPLPLGIAAALATATLVGAINGTLVVHAKLPPFIATLGMMSIARGLSHALCHAHPIGKFPRWFTDVLGKGALLKVPYCVLIMAAVILAGTYLLGYSRWGRHIYAVGGNEEAAHFAGVNVRRIKFLVYTLSGLCCGIAGVLMASYLGVAESTAARGYELDVIAAVVIGGASLMGGSGTCFGALLGAAIMGVLRNGLVLKNIADYYQNISIGAVIIFAVLLDQLRRRS